MLKDMPVAYNLNLIVLDREGRCALVETLDGRMAVKTIDSDSVEQALYATNHPVLEELIPYEPKAFVHSIRRYDNITAFLERHKKGITAGQLKDFFLTPYPELLQPIFRHHKNHGPGPCPGQSFPVLGRTASKRLA